MADRLTLPQQRAAETRKRIVEAAQRVFAQRGYGQATVGDIAAEADISMGALYHHFAGKEELFKALLDEHLSADMLNFGSLGPAASLREAIEQFVAFQRRHLREHLEEGPLSMEFWAVAAGAEWARSAVAEFHQRIRQLIAGVLAVGQSGGAIRADLDVDAAALLLMAVFEGLGTIQAIDPEGVDLERLAGPWADLMERFIGGEGETDIAALQERAAGLIQQLGGQRETSDEGEVR